MCNIHKTNIIFKYFWLLYTKETAIPPLVTRWKTMFLYYKEKIISKKSLQNQKFIVVYKIEDF